MSLGSLQNGRRGPTDFQRAHALKIAEACELVRLYMHDAEGTVHPGEHQEHIFMGERMKRAAGFLEIAEMLAGKAALE
jgi:hypothetical protein